MRRFLLRAAWAFYLHAVVALKKATASEGGRYKNTLVGGGDGLLAFGDGWAEGEKFVATGVAAKGG